MKGFLDTSVLVPVFYGDHVHHEASLALFLRFDKSTGSCGAHSLAEGFSTLTRMPGKHRISGAQAMLFVGNICKGLSLMSLYGEEYARALGAAAALGVVGGGSMTQCSHIALKPKRRRSTAGTRGTTRSADRKSRSVCERLKSLSAGAHG